MSYKRDSRVFVGNLPIDVKQSELETLFEPFGDIVKIEIKNRRNPAFAFIEYDDPRDAEDAVDARNRYSWEGYMLRVEFSNAGSSGERTRRYRSPIRRSSLRRTAYRVSVEGIPPSGSWQDLKDHMRRAGDVAYANVYDDGSGIVEYLSYQDMKDAVRKLDDSRFKSHEGETGYITVREVRDDYRRSYSRYSRSSSRSRSRSPAPRRSYYSPSPD